MKHWLYVDGRETASLPYIGQPSMSMDGKLIAVREETEEEEWFIRIGDRREGPYEYVTDPVMTPDGSTVAYAFRRDKQWILRRGATETAFTVKPSIVFISPNGASAGWVVVSTESKDGYHMRVTVFGRTGEAFGLVGIPVISPVEPLVAYGAEQDGKKYIVIGSRKTETPDRVGDPVFSPDGRKVGYGARTGRELWWKVLDVASHR